MASVLCQQRLAYYGDPKPAPVKESVIACSGRFQMLMGAFWPYVSESLTLKSKYSKFALESQLNLLLSSLWQPTSTYHRPSRS
jgi:hypothetical protein